MDQKIKDKKILLLAVECNLTNVIYNSLKEDFTICSIVFEKPVSKKQLIYRRIKKLGLLKVFGQILFQIVVAPILKKESEKRIQHLVEIFGLSTKSVEESKIIKIDSVNHSSVADLIKKFSPDAIVVNGTRILSQSLIESLPVKIFNIHAGITPLYRGVHGAYWALASNDKLHCGVTVHFIDSGIDTGEIIAQSLIEPAREDNFYSYPYLQFASGILLLKKALNQYLKGELILQKESKEKKSKLWYHPTLFRYLYLRFTKGIK